MKLKELNESEWDNVDPIDDEERRKQTNARNSALRHRFQLICDRLAALQIKYPTKCRVWGSFPNRLLHGSENDYVGFDFFPRLGAHTYWRIWVSKSDPNLVEVVRSLITEMNMIHMKVVPDT